MGDIRKHVNKSNGEYRSGVKVKKLPSQFDIAHTESEGWGSLSWRRNLTKFKKPPRVSASQSKDNFAACEKAKFGKLEKIKNVVHRNEPCEKEACSRATSVVSSGTVINRRTELAHLRH